MNQYPVLNDKYVSEEIIRATGIETTMKWIFFWFRRVREFSFVEEGRRIANLNDEFSKILWLLARSLKNITLEKIGAESLIIG